MAWASMIAGLAFPLLLLFTESDQLGAIAGPFYVFVGAVVGAYIGFATVDDRWQKEGDLNAQYQERNSRGRGGVNSRRNRGMVDNRRYSDLET
jgi:hypothetical protein